MNEFDPPAELTPHEQAVVQRIERVLADPAAVQTAPGSLDELCVRLVQLGPPVDPAFVQDLDARIGVALAAHAPLPPPAQPQIWSGGRRRSRVLLSLGLGVVAMVLLAVLVVAPVRARVQQYFERYGVVLVDTTMPTPLPAPGAVARAEPVTPVLLTLAEAQQRVPFAIRTPQRVPAELRLVGAWVGNGPWGCSAATLAECATITPPLQVSLTYRSARNPDAVLTVEITEVTPEGGGGYAYAAEAAEAVEVNGHPGVYVHGTWRNVDDWDGTADAGTLAWEADGLAYRLASTHLGWSKAEHVQIAESLK